MTTPIEPPWQHVRRAPHVLCLWQDGRRIVQSARAASGVPASSLVMDLLDRLGQWTDVGALSAALDLPLETVIVLLDGLAAHGLVEMAAAGLDPGPLAQIEPVRKAVAGIGPWDRWSPAARLFHAATRDVAFERRGSAAAPRSDDRPAAVLPPLGSTEVPLPPPRFDGSLRQALRARRTHRRFADAPLSAQDLGTLLGSTFGVQAWAHADEGPLALKSSPSGGARHSLEAFAWVRRVGGVPTGLYHYRGDTHVLTRLEGRTAPACVTAWLPAQSGYDGAPLVVALASVLDRVAWRYRSARAYRVVLIEAGHLAQTFCLVATALGLAPFCTAALADSVIEQDLGLDAETRPAIYAMGAGHPVTGEWQPHADRPAPRLVPTPLGRALDDPARVTRRASGPRRRPRRGRGR